MSRCLPSPGEGSTLSFLGVGSETLLWGTYHKDNHSPAPSGKGPNGPPYPWPLLFLGLWFFICKWWGWGTPSPQHY
jgi:hypothetical protein